MTSFTQILLDFCIYLYIIEEETSLFSDRKYVYV